jgi:hypothetical protein
MHFDIGGLFSFERLTIFKEVSSGKTSHALGPIEGRD